MNLSRTSPAGPGGGTDAPAPSGSPWLMLAVATAGFAVNFWAWALLSPLGPLFRTEGTLGAISESDVALLVAVPVIVGSLGRIPVGALTDRFGGRVMFPLVSAVTIIPILFIGFLGLDSFAVLLIGGFFLGVGGTAFAVGVPFVNAWFPPERRGLAIGIFGAGMGGTAISALTTVKLYSGLGHRSPFVLTAVILAIYAVVAWFLLRDAPGRTPPAGSLATRLVANAKLPISWQACILYAVAFGGYVAFSVYLPSYLKTAYDLEAADAANRMAGFVAVAVVMRPLGLDGGLSEALVSTRRYFTRSEVSDDLRSLHKTGRCREHLRPLRLPGRRLGLVPRDLPLRPAPGTDGGSAAGFPVARPHRHGAVRALAVHPAGARLQCAARLPDQALHRLPQSRRARIHPAGVGTPADSGVEPTACRSVRWGSLRATTLFTSARLTERNEFLTFRQEQSWTGAAFFARQ